MTLEWHEEAINRTHNRKSFDCGESALNEYLLKFARQNHESGGAKTFVAVSAESINQVIGYYSVCPASLDYADTPESVRQGMGRYDVPVFRLGRLAVDRSAQGRGIGGQLLIAASARCMRVAAQVGGVALLIDAKNGRTASWYAGYGAIPLTDAPLSLVLPFSMLENAIA